MHGGSPVSLSAITPYSIEVVNTIPGGFPVVFTYLDLQAEEG